MTWTDLVGALCSSIGYMTPCVITGMPYTIEGLLGGMDTVWFGE